MRAILVCALALAGCQTVRPYGEKACTAAGFVPPLPASLPVATSETEHDAAQEAKLEDDVDSRLALLAGKVRSKRKELDAREAELKARADQLVAEAKRLAELQERIAGEKKDAIASLNKKPPPRVSAVQTTIALMPPKNAAKVLEAMDDKQAAKVFAQLPPERAAEIFNVMAAPRAARISAVLDSDSKPRRAK